jgi:amino acid adenylation domain-containing protein
MLVGLLGILKAGGAYVAIDPAYPKLRQAFMIEDAAMPLLLTQEELVDALPVTAAQVIRLDSEWSAIAREADTNPDVPLAQNNLAYILYTSGSTGRPKGVAIEHRSVAVFLAWAKSVFSVEELAGTLAATSICFDLSVFELFVPLCCGGTVILAENALALPTLPARDQVTLINTVPSAMTALVNVGRVPSSVRVVNLAGEPLPNSLVQAIYRAGTVEKVYNLYGPSEDTTYSTYVFAEKGATTNPTIGRPIDNTQVYILDEQLQPTPLGASGELCLGGDGLARGYLNRPELTEAKFIPNPFGPGRLYRTGDLARYLADGNIEFLGRMDHQVKVRGFRIELGEVETALEQHPAVERAVVLALPDAQGEKQLAAFLTAHATAVETLAESHDADEHVALWQDVYEETYRQAPAPVDLTFNTTGWQSSYTGQPIPQEEMREWLHQTVERILGLRPEQVLEIGCGTGMLLARVAPHCASYVGLDFSATALEHIRTMQQTIPGLDGVTLFERAADELGDFASERFDIVIINSVVQHFPSADYLVRVLTGASRLVKPGGHILVGDVINLALQETFQTSVQVYRADGSDTSAEVKQRIQQQIAQERDLLLAPPFFLALAQQLPAITHVEILPKRGRFHNQLSRFRYEAILHIHGAVEPRRDLTWMDWQRQKLTLTEVNRLLNEVRPETFAVRNIPNARLDKEVSEMAWLREAGPAENIAQLRAYAARESRRGVEPDELWQLRESPGYRVELSWVNTDAQGVYDAVFTRDDQPARPAAFARDRFGADAKWHSWTNHPQRAKLNRQLIPQLRQFLKDKIPNYMMPAVFTVLEKLPLSPTGKIDRQALAQMPVTLESVTEEKSSAARTPVETLLASAWAEVLNLEYVGVDDDFFVLGGNSLKAMALTHRLQREFKRTLRPVALLQAPTVAQFAAHLNVTYPDVMAELALAGAFSGGVSEIQEGEI